MYTIRIFSYIIRKAKYYRQSHGQDFLKCIRSLVVKTDSGPTTFGRLGGTRLRKGRHHNPLHLPGWDGGNSLQHGDPFSVSCLPLSEASNPSWRPNSLRKPYVACPQSILQLLPQPHGLPLIHFISHLFCTTSRGPPHPHLLTFPLSWPFILQNSTPSSPLLGHLGWGGTCPNQSHLPTSVARAPWLLIALRLSPAVIPCLCDSLINAHLSLLLDYKLGTVAPGSGFVFLVYSMLPGQCLDTQEVCVGWMTVSSSIK